MPAHENTPHRTFFSFISKHLRSNVEKNSFEALLGNMSFFPILGASLNQISLGILGSLKCKRSVLWAQSHIYSSSATTGRFLCVLAANYPLTLHGENGKTSGESRRHLQKREIFCMSSYKTDP